MIKRQIFAFCFVLVFTIATPTTSFAKTLPRDVLGVRLDVSEEAMHRTLRPLGSKTRAQVLAEVIEIDEFKRREFNPAFVLAEYFGYLRRDPDANGYKFWLDVLDNRVPGNYQSMVCAFLSSQEYQDRFSSVRTRNDGECAAGK